MAHVTSAKPGQLELSMRLKVVMAASIFIGALTLLFGLFANSERTWHAYLLSYFYFVSLSLGGLFFVAIQHISNAGWSVTVRRVSESLATFLPVALGAGLILLFGAHHLYSWLDTDYVAADPILSGKAPYLNWGFFIIRMIVFLVLWVLLARVIVGRSVRQDETGDVKLTVKNVPASIAFVLIFALSYSLFSVDLLMSLEPHWFSTIFGVYCFSGAFQAGLAMIILIAIYLRNKNLVNGLITEDHLHDLGKYLKAFTVFWAYIAFSQYILIWYANLPEETVFYYHRSHGGWALISLSLLVFKFVVPFIALLPRWAKRTPGHLAAVSILILVMQFVDFYWLIYPNYNGEEAVLGWYEIGLFLGFLGLFLWMVGSFLSRRNLIPIKDPRLEESLQHHVTY